MSSQRQQVYQDYIAKIRYSNQLPPPPNPPKLLDIPGTGLGPKYTSAGFASRLAREQPLNIEADAELGMPIDLIGIPGVFDGDERAIQMDPHPPPLHPSDRALLRPLASLSKAVGISDSSSFLRRTEYTASSQPQMFSSGPTVDLARLQRDVKRKSVAGIDKEDPKTILRAVLKGFDVAYPQDADKSKGPRGPEITSEEAKAWSHPKHPNKRNVELLDSYPILPDLNALTETGAYIVCKFATNPVIKSDEYDERLNLSIMQPLATPQIEAEYARKMEAWTESSGVPQPLIDWEYEFFMPEEGSVTGIKRKFDSLDPEHDDDELYTDETSDGRRGFKYAKVRRYETHQQSGNPGDVWNDSVGLALHDPETDVGRVRGSKKRLVKGAYLYPVSQRCLLRAKRKVKGFVATSEDDIDQLYVTAKDLDTEDEVYRKVLEHKAQFDPSVQVPSAPEVAAEA